MNKLDAPERRSVWAMLMLPGMRCDKTGCWASMNQLRVDQAKSGKSEKMSLAPSPLQLRLIAAQFERFSHVNAAAQRFMPLMLRDHDQSEGFAGVCAQIISGETVEKAKDAVH